MTASARRVQLEPAFLLQWRLAALQRWQVEAEGGRCWSARFLVMASGPLSTPNRPAFEGLERFAGPVYHTADWPHEAVDFSGQRVGIVGTGSSAVQSIPLIAQPSTIALK